jgi:hypothetical protein
MNTAQVTAMVPTVMTMPSAVNDDDPPSGRAQNRAHGRERFNGGIAFCESRRKTKSQQEQNGE